MVKKMNYVRRGVGASRELSETLLIKSQRYKDNWATLLFHRITQLLQKQPEYTCNINIMSPLRVSSDVIILSFSFHEVHINKVKSKSRFPHYAYAKAISSKITLKKQANLI